MNILSKVLESWTNYELIAIIEVIAFIILLNILLAWILTKDKKSVLYTFTCLISSLISITIVIFCIYLINTSIKKIYSFIFFLSITFSILNIWTLLGFSIKHKKRKNFDVDFVTREHFSDSLKLIFFICIFFAILTAFVQDEIQNILIASGISSTLTILGDIFLGRIFFRDQGSEK